MRISEVERQHWTAIGLIEESLDSSPDKPSDLHALLIRESFKVKLLGPRQRGGHTLGVLAILPH